MGPCLYLHPVKNLHRTAVRGDKMERGKHVERGNARRRQSLVGESDGKSLELFTFFSHFLAWSVMKRGCNEQCTKHNVPCVLCKHSVLNLSNICSAVISNPPTKPPTCNTIESDCQNWLYQTDHNYLVLTNFLSSPKLKRLDLGKRKEEGKKRTP